MLAMVCSLSAQTTVDVDVSGIAFTPANVTVFVGDTVRWTNTGGFHNVNGTTATYPSNPESFGNATANAPWVFTHVFTITGVYDYQCDIHIGSNMVGTVTVLIPTSIEDKANSKLVSNIYPNPVMADFLTIELDKDLSGEYQNLSLLVMDNAGRKVTLVNRIENNRIEIDTKEWNNGVYHYQLMNKGQLIYSDKFIVQQ